MARVPADNLLDRATDPEYAAVSIAAVVGLLFSVAGVTTLLLRAVFLLVVPAAGLVTSAVALRGIARSRGVLTGSGLAGAGILLGAALLLVAGAQHLLAWHQETRVLGRLQADTLDVVQEIESGDYEGILRRMPVELHDMGPKVLASLRARFGPLLAGAGKVTERRLLSLRPQTLENGDLVAQARLLIACERRIVEITVTWWRARDADPADPAWLLYNLGGEETFESVRKFGTAEGRTTPLSTDEPPGAPTDETPAPEPAEAPQAPSPPPASPPVPTP
jgi:hypothetical protein